MKFKYQKYQDQRNILNEEQAHKNAGKTENETNGETAGAIVKFPQKMKQIPYTRGIGNPRLNRIILSALQWFNIEH